MCDARRSSHPLTLPSSSAPHNDPITCTHTRTQLKALVEEGKSLPKYGDAPLDGFRPKPIVDAGRDAFY